MSWLVAIGMLLIVAGGWVVFFGAPYVPAKRRDVAEAFDKLCPLTARDTVVDLGSGDGRVLREVAARGARAVGFEINPLLVLVSRWLTPSKRAATQLANAWTTPFPADTTVVYVFADGRDAKKVIRTVEREATRCKRSLVVISYGFQLPGQRPASRTNTHYRYDIAPLHA